jgi:DNA polymerase III alpha subunit
MGVLCSRSSQNVRIDQYGQIILGEQDLVNLVMQGQEVWNMERVVVDNDVDLERAILTVEAPSAMVQWTFPEASDIAVPDWDHVQQQQWYMPEIYKSMDIAAHVLDLCESDAELQRCGQELLMYQERGLMDLLRYLRYLVDVMRENRVIWGVGRGSSVASYVLYKLGVHRIDSLYYELDPTEFLR